MAESEAAIAALIAQAYRRRIGVLMQQAAHWAANGKPLAAHYRLHKADAYYQIVAECERFAQFGENPFEAMRRELAKPPLKTLGAYPPSAELVQLREPEFVMAALKEAEGRDE